MKGGHEEWRALLIAHASGMLEGPEQAVLEAHVQRCPTCRRELAAWESISAAVRAQPVATPSRAGRYRLLALVRAQRQRSLSLVPLLLRSQAKVIRGEIWAASAVMLAIGLLVTLASGSPGGEALAFVMVAPIVAAVGMSFIYGPAVDPALETELASPTSARLVLLARLLLVFSFDLLLALGGSGLLALLWRGVPLWPLVSTWLAPMAFLSGLSLVLSVLSSDPGAGVLVSLSLWGLQVVYSLGGFEGTRLQLPDLTAPAAQPWLWALTLSLWAAALWGAGRAEWCIRRRA